MIPREARQLARLILATAKARGVPLEERLFRLEIGLPTLHVRLADRALRGCRVRFPGDPAVAEYGNPDVITVHGSGERSSKMWPRKLDGTFNVVAAADHLLHLVAVELSRPVPELDVPSGLPARASGLVVLHLAAVRLGVIRPGSKPGDLVENIKDDVIKRRVERNLARDGLIDADLRAVGDANGMFVSRSTKIDYDPFEVWSDHTLPMLKLGRASGGKIERRHVLIIDDRSDAITVADPAGSGLTRFTRRKLKAAWKLGARNGVPWVGSVSAR